MNERKGESYGEYPNLGRAFYVYDPLPTLQTLQTLNGPAAGRIGGLDTPEGAKANVRKIKQIGDQAVRWD